ETFLPKVSGRWCMVHGRVLPSDMDGWVHVQFHSDHVWCQTVLEIYLLLQTYVFPSSEIEDNMLCPQCVQRNKKIMKRLLALGKGKEPDVDTSTPLLLEG
ncbi:PREDICTED: developmental pluripotency-associated protein 2-like, partial [Elephantulus edwardii]|uniref:developmental pluripotency-associated protein 2-like n=1 Tax=Elephantulus edwardii TaxID=28737 RepID=UPI0003F0E4DF